MSYHSQKRKVMVSQIYEITRDMLDESDLATLLGIAQEHAKRNGSVRASEEMRSVIDIVIRTLREDGKVIVPVTQTFVSDRLTNQISSDDKPMSNYVAGAGRGGKTVALYSPKNEDDLLFIRHAIQQIATGGGKVKRTTDRVVSQNLQGQLSNEAGHRIMAERAKALQPTDPTEVKRLASKQALLA